MSKESALRAMREARFSARSARATTSPVPVRPAAPPKVDEVAKADEVEEASAPAPTGSTDALCGHRSMNGRTCTREQGHEAKSHRYN